MRLILVFLASVVAAVALIGFVAWRADPFGDFYDGRVVSAAAATSPACVISDDLVGPSAWLQFKFELAHRGRPRTIVVGTSRVLKMESRPGERDFVNLGLPATTPAELASYFAEIHRQDPGRLTVFVGADYFWFNAAWRQSFAAGSSDTRGKIRALLTRQRLGASLSRVVAYPGLLLHRWHRVRVVPGCGLDRAKRLAAGEVQAWRVDGALDYPWELVANPAFEPPDDYGRDLATNDPATFGGGYYQAYSALDPDRVHQLDDALKLAKSYGWRVVGFVSPYSPRYVERLSTAPVTKVSWRDYAKVVPRFFRAYGFPFVDLRDVRDVPCASTAFVDDGWHPNAACMNRVRARLEAALRR
jgi:hypothetical protein